MPRKSDVPVFEVLAVFKLENNIPIDEESYAEIAAISLLLSEVLCVSITFVFVYIVILPPILNNGK